MTQNKTNVTRCSRKLGFITLLLMLLLLTQSSLPAFTQALPLLPASNPMPVAQGTDGEETGIVYRTRITIKSAADWQRLEQLDVLVLQEADDWALLLVDEAQLQELASLGFSPKATNALDTLISAHAERDSGLASSLQPLLTEAKAVAARPKNEPNSRAFTSLRTTIHAITPEQRASLAMLTNVDNDGDGLTNTEESWWCTDANNPNSDGDVNGYTDGEEVAVLLDFNQPSAVRWTYGPPFGPPSAWPNWNQPGGCNDGDFDTIPDQAEAYMVGTRVGIQDSENTDGDKFDDGQELFGITYCPGGNNYCGYGSYPRTQDFSFINSGMPSWIKPPGDSPFIAAYPTIEFEVDPTTIQVVTKEIRTIERTITQGEEIATGFEETEGTATTVGTIDTNTHSTWQEQSTTEGGIEPARMNFEGYTQAQASSMSVPFHQIEAPTKSVSQASTTISMPSGYILPIPMTETWYYTGGPHNYYGGALGYEECESGPRCDRAWSSIDIAPPDANGCAVSKHWVVAAQAGEVVESGKEEGLVVIQHDDGWKTYYLHLDPLERVEKGKEVKQGEQIGGDKGAITGRFDPTGHAAIDE